MRSRCYLFKVAVTLTGGSISPQDVLAMLSQPHKYMPTWLKVGINQQYLIIAFGYSHQRILSCVNAYFNDVFFQFQPIESVHYVMYDKWRNPTPSIVRTPFASLLLDSAQSAIDQVPLGTDTVSYGKFPSHSRKRKAP